MYFNQWTQAACASCSSFAFQASSGTKNTFCAQTQGFKAVPYTKSLYFLKGLV